jgi:ABC-type multidrug transport system fused ATPase/permease subunit
MDLQSDNPKQLYGILKIIFFAMFSGILIFLMVVIFLSHEEIKEQLDLQNTLVLALLGLTLLGIPLSIKISGKVIKKIDKNLPLIKKVEGFSNGWIIRMAVIEGVSLFCIVALLMTHDHRFLFIVILLLMFFLMNFPSISKMAQMLHLTKEEIDILS